MLTVDEMERAAYMAGDTRTAQLCAALQDAQAQIDADAVTHEAAIQCAWDEGYNQGAKDERDAWRD